jgi:hemolysin activation/secretion protein
MKHTFKLITLASALQATFGQAWAQTSTTTPPPGSIQQNIDQSVNQLPKPKVKPLANIDVLGLENTESIDRLLGLEIQSAALQDEIQKYWASSIGKPVSADELQNFNGWLFEESRRLGFLSYAQTEIKKSDGGSILVVKILRPKINAVRVIAKNPALLRSYGALITQRFEQDFKANMPVDTLGLDQRLDSASYDLPIELDATIRAVAPEQIDLIVSIADAPNRLGKLIDGVAQLNTYGLRQYGIPQVMGSLVMGGHEPKASLSLVGQKSEGITYGRGEYESALEGAQSRWRVWTGGSNSRNIKGGQSTTLGRSGEVGLGITRIHGGFRDFVFKQSVEIAARQGSSTLESTGAVTTRVHDNQFRVRINADNEKLARDASRAEFTYTLGNYSLIEGQTQVDPSIYAKIELALRSQKSWNQDGSLFSVLKFRGQMTSARLDSYNQLSLGGIGGVRAYTTVDGTGDDGAVASFELNRRLSNGILMGGFYDAGLIKLKNPAANGTEPRNKYTLQAIGLQLSGNVQQASYSLTLAKGLGGYSAWTPYNIESTPNNWRLNAALTYVF